MRFRLLPILAVLATAVSCTPDDPAKTPLLVLAAASLNQVMPELIDAWQEDNGMTQVELVFGSTGNLAAQIENGAPAHLFFAADVETVERLVGTGRVDSASVTIYGRGELAMLSRDGGRIPADLAELGDPAFEVIAIANPEHAPYGAAAQQALRAAGVWDLLQPRLVYGENVAQSYQLAKTGNADVAIVARSVLTPGDQWGPVDARLYSPIDQAVGVTSERSHPKGSDFLNFVLSAEGQAILAAGGFGPPEG